MAKQTFAPIPLAAMQTNMGNPGFTSLAASDLGSDGTAADGFDAVLGNLITQVGAELPAVPYLGWLTALADFSGDSPDSTQWLGAVSSFQSLLMPANAVLASTIATLAVGPGQPPVPPALSPAPAPITPPAPKPAPVPPRHPIFIYDPVIYGPPVVPGTYCDEFWMIDPECPPRPFGP